MENGKNRTEALASVLKGNETLEYACSLPHLAQRHTLQMSRGITCQDVRDLLGVVACIVPFNFPIMVPMWTIPIALTMGNCVILKPSEKAPLTMTRAAELLHQAGVPKGGFQIINGSVGAVNSLCDHTKIVAVTFARSSHVAQLVARRCHALDKRVLAFGGAKNHLVALPDADIEMATKYIVISFAGCAGQRCMVASVLNIVGDCDALLAKIAEKSKELCRGTEASHVGALIDEISKSLKYISEAEGVKSLVDVRSWAKEAGWDIQFYCIQPRRCCNGRRDFWSRSLRIPKLFSDAFRAGMIGNNIRTPVHVSPLAVVACMTQQGNMDITVMNTSNFFSLAVKLLQSGARDHLLKDEANFSGQM
ncbi:putative methylmalonate-semialdehyde dehydrogenase, aldehyde/histidinol dehydrogenase [Plasmopara halstedii]